MFKFVHHCNGVRLPSLYSIPNFHAFLLYSTQITPSFANFLVESLGFSHQQSLLTSAKLEQSLAAKKVSDLNFAAKANSVIEILTQHGFDRTQIRKAVSLEPRILCCRIESTLKTRLKLLQELGFSGSDLINFISSNPGTLKQNLKPTLKLLQELGVYGSDLFDFVSSNPGILKRNLKSAVQALRTVLDNDANVIRIIKKSNWAYFGSVNYLVPNVALLTSYGIPKDKIQKRIMQNCKPFLMKTERVRVMLSRVEEKLGIPRHSGMFLYGFYLVAFVGDRNFESKCRVFEGFGWRKLDLALLIRQYPFCFSSSKARLKKSLSYLMTELDYEPAFLISRPSLLSYSVEKRLIPRNRVLQILKEKGLVNLNYSLYNVVCLTEPRFLQRFICPFKDMVPDIEQLYASCKGVQLLAPT